MALERLDAFIFGTVRPQSLFRRICCKCNRSVAKEHSELKKIERELTDVLDRQITIAVLVNFFKILRSEPLAISGTLADISRRMRGIMSMISEKCDVWEGHALPTREHLDKVRGWCENCENFLTVIDTFQKFARVFPDFIYGRLDFSKDFEGFLKSLLAMALDFVKRAGKSADVSKTHSRIESLMDIDPMLTLATPLSLYLRFAKQTLIDEYIGAVQGRGYDRKKTAKNILTRHLKIGSPKPCNLCECVYFLEKFKRVVVLDCSHSFHEKCLASSFRKGLQCPVCGVSYSPKSIEFLKQELHKIFRSEAAHLLWALSLDIGRESPQKGLVSRYNQTLSEEKYETLRLLKDYENEVGAQHSSELRSAVEEEYRLLQLGPRNLRNLEFQALFQDLENEDDASISDMLLDLDACLGNNEGLSNSASIFGF